MVSCGAGLVRTRRKPCSFVLFVPFVVEVFF
jgi:hypothetical protein